MATEPTMMARTGTRPMRRRDEVLRRGTGAGNVSLDLRAGERVCLVGDNGAGKSTLVKILSGIFAPDRGQILIDEQSGQPHPPGRAQVRDRSRVSGSRAVRSARRRRQRDARAGADSLSSRPAAVHRSPRGAEDTRRRIREIGIELDDLTSPVRQLSGGQRQAIAIARATVRGHRLVIFDEPTAG